MHTRTNECTLSLHYTGPVSIVISSTSSPLFPTRAYNTVNDKSLVALKLGKFVELYYFTKLNLPTTSLTFHNSE